VIYTPTDEGQDIGCLTVVSEDPFEPEINLSLSGSGTVASNQVVDLDILSFSATGKVKRRRDVTISLEIRNAGTLDEPRQATVVGVQNGTEAFSETKMVSAPVQGSTQYLFGPFTPKVVGDIEWSVTISDDDPDEDTATSVTRVIKGRFWREDDTRRDRIEWSDSDSYDDPDEDTATSDSQERMFWKDDDTE